MPTVRKRQLTLSGASIDSDAPQLVKRARMAGEVQAGEAPTTSDLETENRELRKLVADAFAFVDKKELIAQAPAPIKKASLGKTTQNHRRTLTTSDDISKRTIPLFNEIRTTILLPSQGGSRLRTSLS